jgi:hypothetical protein
MKKLPQWLKGLIVGTLSFQLGACGTIMHPERKGQTGRGAGLDVGVVLLDGIGLFFFIIPGVIAYAVDFSNGTIYLPGGDHHTPKTIAFDTKNSTPESLRQIIRKQTGYDVHWQDERLVTIRLKNKDEMTARFLD